MSHQRQNVNWSVDSQQNYPAATLATLMDIRHELRTLNRLLNCDNFLTIPQILRNVEANTKKKKKRRRRTPRRSMVDHPT